jgi:hypothetical protein
MNLADLIKSLKLVAFSDLPASDRPVEGGYVSDLLSDVMANSRKDDVWITMQVHPNIVAVAILKELAAIVLVNGRQPAEETLEQARKEGIVILGSPLPAFELVGRMYEIGIKGTR